MELYERCLEKTMELVSEQCTHFTMSELAASLGISKKTVYQMFESKEELLLAVAEHGFTQIKQCEQQILQDPALSLTEKIRRLIIVLPEQYQKVNWYRVEVVAEKYPAVYRCIRRHLETGWEPTLALLQQGIDEGELSPFSLPVFQVMVIGSMEYFLTAPAFPESGMSYQQALDAMMDVLMKGIERRT